jgi:4-hydroxy-3-methylbut-2-en-1-yl diphosphate reductase
MKNFNIPEFYRSPIIDRVKNIRNTQDPRRKDNSPAILDFGSVQIAIARHFGFCYGVKNAVEIAFRAVDENPGKRVFLLSEMIHNPEVNRDLVSRGVNFLMSTDGKEIVPFSSLTPDDVVVIPAFGTTLKIEEQLRAIGIEPAKYDTTCPFVEKVWKRSSELGNSSYTNIIHGKPGHEETRATFSRAASYGPAIVVKDMHEAQQLGAFMLGKLDLAAFNAVFGNRVSEGFDPQAHLERVGVINQTTMLASDTQAIADYFKQVMAEKYAAENEKQHFADTRDTLCYATNENQDATYGLLNWNADAAIVIGGYNSSNTSHLVELCERKFPTYFIKDETEIHSSSVITHFDLHTHSLRQTENWLPQGNPSRIIITSGASCPDSIVERVLNKVVGYFSATRSSEEALQLLEVAL